MKGTHLMQITRLRLPIDQLTTVFAGKIYKFKVLKSKKVNDTRGHKHAASMLAALVAPNLGATATVGAAH